MRERVRRRVAKRLRRNRELAHVAGRRDLRVVALDRAVEWHWRAAAARLLAGVGNYEITPRLLAELQELEDADALFQLALVIEAGQDKRAIPALVAALDPMHPWRCRAAARALGWMFTRSREVAAALSRVMLNRDLPALVRAEAAESIAYVNARSQLEALVEALRDAEPLVRFFAVFALGHTRVTGPTAEARAAIETMLHDEAAPEGWWSVRREALGVLGGEALLAEMAAVEANPAATELDRNWAGFYSPHCPLPKAR